MSTTSRPALPTPDHFRKWLRDSIASVETTPSALSIAADLSKNTASRFLNSGGSLTLQTASAFERELLARAQVKGITLPPAFADEKA
ncbi:MAG: hypothetical protein AAF982_02610 [Pseudomonadota bacterium]